MIPNEALQTKTVGDRLVFRVGYDAHPVSPREETDTLLTEIVAWHSRVKIADHDRYATAEAFRRSIRTHEIVKPLYMVSHGSIALSLTPYSDRWDSGQVGYVRVKPDRIKYLGLGGADAERIDKLIANEVEVFSRYLGGENYCMDVHLKVPAGIIEEVLSTAHEIRSLDTDELDEAACHLLDDAPADTDISYDDIKEAAWL